MNLFVFIAFLAVLVLGGLYVLQSLIHDREEFFDLVSRVTPLSHDGGRIVARAVRYPMPTEWSEVSRQLSLEDFGTVLSNCVACTSIARRLCRLGKRCTDQDGLEDIRVTYSCWLRNHCMLMLLLPVAVTAWLLAKIGMCCLNECIVRFVIAYGGEMICVSDMAKIIDPPAAELIERQMARHGS